MVGGATEAVALTTSAANMVLLFKLMQSSYLWGVVVGGVTSAVAPTTGAAYWLVLVKFSDYSNS